MSPEPPSRREQLATVAGHLIELLEPLASVNGSAAREHEHGGSPDEETRSILATIQALMTVLHPGRPLFAAFHDGQVHNPLGAGAYACEQDVVGPLLLALANDEVKVKPLSSGSSSRQQQQQQQDEEASSTEASSSPAGAAAPAPVGRLPMATRPIVIHAGAQPNNSPHVGTLTVFCLAFSLAGALRDRLRLLPEEEGHRGRDRDGPPVPDVSVEITFVDTAPVKGQGCEVEGVSYQRSYRDVVPSELESHLADYNEVFEFCSAQSGGIPFKTKFQSDFFAPRKGPGEAVSVSSSVSPLVEYIVSHRRRLGPQLSPKYHAIALRAACPVPGCALAEKHGVLNDYGTPGQIAFNCPSHGRHVISLSRPEDVARLEANAPTRNLIRSMVHLLDHTTHHVCITGADYAGMYQEAFLYRTLAEWSASTGRALGRTPHNFYAPQIVDWSGAKLSKTLYVCDGGYDGLELRLWDEINSCVVANPRKLFRAGFSVDYMKNVLDGESAITLAPRSATLPKYH